METRPRRATPLADTVERHEFAMFTRWGLGAWLVTSGVGAFADAAPTADRAPSVRAEPATAAPSADAARP